MSFRRVLVTRLRHLGDVVMSTPVLETLRHRLPHARIEYLTYAPYAPALYHHPALDRIHTLPPRPGLRATLSAVRRLRSPRIDWWIDLFGNPCSVVLMTLSQPRHSVGPDCGLRTALYEYRRRRRADDGSAVRAHLDKLAPLLGPVPLRRTRLYALAGPGPAASGDDARGAVPGRDATRPAVRAERVTALCGGEVERLPHLGLRDLLALLSWTSLYIGNDGGALHSAVALGVPTVGLFGPTDPDAWFPYTDWGPHRVVRRDRAAEDDRPGRHDSRLRDITVEEVFRAAREVRALARSHRVEPLDWSPDRSR